MPVRTVGIHLIWTTYGTWLPGDPDKPGHWSPLFDVYGHLLRAGHRLNLPHAATYAFARSCMKEPVKVLTSEEQALVGDVLRERVESAPAERDSWRSPGAGHGAPAKAGAMWGVRAYACAIEATHVHLLVGPVGESIGRFVGRIKGATASALLDLEYNAGRRHAWTRGYWKVFLFDMDGLIAVQRYIENHNARAGRAASPFSWLRPLGW